MKMNKVSAALMLFVLCFNCISCSDSSNKQVDNASKPTTPPTTNKNDVNNAIANDIAQVVDKSLDNKRIKDSIQIANKKDVWVYQIGIAYADEKTAEPTYDKIDTLGNIYIFEKNKHEYYIVKNDGYSREKLDDSLPSIRRKLNSMQVSEVNLATICPGKKQPMNGDKIKYRIKKGKKKFAECLICN